MSKFNHSLIYLPREITNKLSRKALLVQMYLDTIFRKRKEVIALEYAEINPSLDSIANGTGLSRWQASRALADLKAAGLISVRQLRTRTNEWFYNVYRLGEHFKALWKTFKEKKNSHKITGLHKSANIENKEALEDSYEDILREISRRVALQSRQPRYSEG